MLRELIVEHLFLGEILRHCWNRRVLDVEISRSEIDAFGYDLMIGRGAIVRHVQLKSVRLGGRASVAKIARKLSDKPSGCIVWIVLRDDLSFDHFLWFGSEPGQPLPTLERFPIAKHTKANADGVKTSRPAHCIVPRGEFQRIETLAAMVKVLIGPV